MTNQPSDQTIVLHLLRGAVPERSDEICRLWEKYGAEIEVAPSAAGITMNADRHRVRFDTKTIDLFWLLGFSAWYSIEVYSPSLMITMLCGLPIEQAIQIDEELSLFERNYKERVQSAASLIAATSTDEIVWPPDVPKPSPDRDGLSDQEKVAFDLTTLALAFALLHEISHVRLLVEKAQPDTLADEELACDVWAREFMTAKLSSYAEERGHNYEEVSQKRAMALGLAVTIISAITPTAEQWGNSVYPPLADRTEAIIANFNLPEDSHFYLVMACLLVGIFRQKHLPLEVIGHTPKALVEALIAQMR
jgi:hypothetical protein